MKVVEVVRNWIVASQSQVIAVYFEILYDNIFGK